MAGLLDGEALGTVHAHPAACTEPKGLQNLVKAQAAPMTAMSLRHSSLCMVGTRAPLATYLLMLPYPGSESACMPPARRLNFDVKLLKPLSLPVMGILGEC